MDRNSLRMAYAQNLMGSANPRPGSWVEGAAGMGQQLLGALLARKTMDMQDKQQQEFGKLLSDFSASPAAAGPDRARILAGILSGSGNPMAQQAGQNLLVSSLMKEPADEKFSGSLQTVMGPEGKPMLVQAGSRGTIRPAQGYAPQPQEPKAAADKWLRLPDGSYINPDTKEKIFDPEAFARDLQGKATGATRVQTNVSPTAIYSHEEGAGMREMFSGLGKRLEDQQAKAQQTADTARSIGALNRELEGVPSGTGAQVRVKALKALGAVGLTGPESQAEVAKAESAQRLSGGMVMDQLNAMKGPATEREREYLEGITPSIATTAQGRSAMETVASHQAERERAKANAAAEVANQVQQRALPIGEAQKMVRDLNSQIDADFDKRFKPPSLSGGATKPATGGSGGQKPPRIKIDAQGNIIK